MKTTIYTIGELQDYIQSDQYLRSDILPVSPERVHSYLNNPRAEKQMPVLFTLTENEQLVAYRTVLPDHFNDGSQQLPFAWLSGNFVAPAHRRRGLSTLLFKAAGEAWNGRLMYTNYAPASKAVYDHSEAFTEFSVRPGKRYYMRSALATLYRERAGSNRLLKFTDHVVNGLHDLFSSAGQFPLPPGTGAEEIDTPGDSFKKLIAQYNGGSLFGRGAAEFEWIRSFPWVTEKPDHQLPGKYHFTREVSRFRNSWYRIKSEKGTAFLWITIVNEKLSVPYFFHADPLHVVAARQLVLNAMLSHRSAWVTIRHPELGPVLGTRKNPFILSRSMPQRYFAHRSLAPAIPRDREIHDGDGDCVFT
jgi:hypothetical protein